MAQKLLPLCDVDAVPPGTALRVEPPDRLLAVFNLDGTFYVTDDTCTHGPGSLSAGGVEGDVALCDFHSGAFHIPSGRAVRAPCRTPVRTYPVTIADGKVCIRVKDRP